MLSSVLIFCVFVSVPRKNKKKRKRRRKIIFLEEGEEQK